MAEPVLMTNVKPQKDAIDLRKSPRMKLSLPIQIMGQDSPSNKWQEISHLLEVSKAGASFLLKHPTPPGLILHLSFPMPWKLRQYSHAEPSYKIYAVVRNILKQLNDEYRVGVEFIGEHPPATYLSQPWAIYSSALWHGEERRKAVRKKMCKLMWVEYYDHNNHLVMVEQGGTENLSKTGARICVQNPPLDSARVKVFELGTGFETFAKIIRQFLGKDGLHRLCVQFTDKQWTLEERRHHF